MKRRDFLKIGLSTTVFAILSNQLKAISLFKSNNLQLPTWADLVEIARWCPSVHNLQPHKLKPISDSEAELYYEVSRLLPVGDKNSRFATVALGVFVEHLSIVAGAYNVKVEIVDKLNPINENATGLQLFCKLKMVPSSTKENLDKSLILKRRTSRRHYNGKLIKPELLMHVKNQFAEFNHSLFYEQSHSLVNFIIKLNQQTLFEDLGSEKNRHELDRLFRYSHEEAENKKDGLWSKCMGFPGGLIKSVFKHYEKWMRHPRNKVIAAYYKKSFKGTTTICWVAGKFEDTLSWFNAGRALARSWLIITKHNAYIQPFGSLVTNENAYKQITEKFKDRTNNQNVWMLFRIGYSKEPTRSYRLNTNEIIIN